MFSLSIGLIYLELWKIRHSLNINHIIGSIWSSFGSSRLINVAPFKSIDICFDVFSLLLPIVVYFQCYNFTPNQLYVLRLNFSLCRMPMLKCFVFVYAFFLVLPKTPTTIFSCCKCVGQWPSSWESNGIAITHRLFGEIAKRCGKCWYFV